MAVTSVTIPLRISPSLKDKVEVEAKRLGKSQNELMRLAIEHYMTHTEERPRLVVIDDFKEEESEFEGKRIWEAHVDGYTMFLTYDPSDIKLHGTEWMLEIADDELWDATILLPPGGAEPNWFMVLKSVNKRLKQQTDRKTKGWD